jgi:hypothetical protein
MQRAPDCDMSLVHDDDLIKIYKLCHDAVSGLLISSRIVLLMLVVAENL